MKKARIPYQPRGTDIVRPSVNSTVKESSEVETFYIRVVIGPVVKILIPFIQYHFLVLRDKYYYLIYLIAIEALAEL
jgi:hypothetical protein